MSTTDVTSDTTAEETAARPWRDRKRYLWPLATLMPAMPFVGAGLAAATGWAGWWWIGPMILFVILPTPGPGLRRHRRQPAGASASASRPTATTAGSPTCYLPIQYASLVLCCWVWATWDLGPGRRPRPRR